VTYKGSSAVAAHGDLWLVGVDVDLGVAGRAATTVAHDDAVVRPPDGLLVDELHGRVRLWLESDGVSDRVRPSRRSREVYHTWRSKSVCSNLGPVMASDRGR